MDFLDNFNELPNNSSPLSFNITPGNSPLSFHLMEPNNLSMNSAAADSAADDDISVANAVSAVPTVALAPTLMQRLELKIPFLSSSSSDSEPEDSANPTAGTSASAENADGARPSSPPPNCAICLGRCKNKCFTDSCMHQFCFKCLCEWSKVKPECPLCKQTFKSIIHNVKSMDQFEEYHVQPPTVQIPSRSFDLGFADMRIFVHQGRSNRTVWNDSVPIFYRHIHHGNNEDAGVIPESIPPARPAIAATVSSGSSGGGGGGGGRAFPLGGSSRDQYVYRGELLDLYRQEYPDALASSGTLSQLWRRYVYDRKLYAMPVSDITGRFRDSSARFYRDNPSQVHRLMPWINRDIVCLLRNTQHNVTSVLESINDALMLMNILSPGFRRRLNPFLGDKTVHFIHELHNFARSPYDMIGYDRAVQYAPQANDEIIIEFSSSDEITDDNEQIDVDGGGGGAGGAGAEGANASLGHEQSRSATANSGGSARTSSGVVNAINLTIHNRLSSNSAGRNAAINAITAGGGGEAAGGSGVGVSSQQDQTGDSNGGNMQLVIDLSDEMAGNTSSSSSAVSMQHGLSTVGNTNNSAAAHRTITTAASSPIQAATVAEVELTSSSSDECEFVLERKPPHLRTPEMVSLDSASDSDVVFVDESNAAQTVPMNTFTYSDDEDQAHGATPGIHNLRPATSLARKKMSALVQAKKRNRNANAVKDEENKAAAELYNEGASTSAGIRSSLRRRRQRNTADSEQTLRQRSMERKQKYALRKIQQQLKQAEAWSQEPATRRGKRLSSESSNSTASMCSSMSTAFSSSTTSTLSVDTTSLEDSSDMEYVATASQRRRQQAGPTKRTNRLKGKANKRKASNKCKDKGADGKRHKKLSLNNYGSDSDDDDDDNGHMGKNYALVMAIGERLKRQNQQKQRCQEHNSLEEDEDEEDNDVEHKKDEDDDDDDASEHDQSEGENSWRLKAINEPLRRKQQQTANTLFKNPANRRRKLEHAERRNATKKSNASKKEEDNDAAEETSQPPKRLRPNEGCNPKGKQMPSRRFTTSDDDESDDINLGDLKTKLKSCEDLSMKSTTAEQEQNTKCNDTKQKEEQQQQQQHQEQQHEQSPHISSNLAQNLPPIPADSIKQEDSVIKQEPQEPSTSTNSSRVMTKLYNHSLGVPTTSTATCSSTFADDMPSTSMNRSATAAATSSPVTQCPDISATTFHSAPCSPSSLSSSSSSSTSTASLISSSTPSTEDDNTNITTTMHDQQQHRQHQPSLSLSTHCQINLPLTATTAAAASASAATLSRSTDFDATNLSEPSTTFSNTTDTILHDTAVNFYNSTTTPQSPSNFNEAIFTATATEAATTTTTTATTTTPATQTQQAINQPEEEYNNFSNSSLDSSTSSSSSSTSSDSLSSSTSSFSSFNSRSIINNIVGAGSGVSGGAGNMTDISEGFSGFSCTGKQQWH